jgi:hypothetical protein
MPAALPSAYPRQLLLKIASDAEVDWRIVKTYLLDKQPRARRSTARAIKKALPLFGIADPHPEYPKAG